MVPTLSPPFPMLFCIWIPTVLSSGRITARDQLVKKVDSVITSTTGLFSKFVWTKEEKDNYGRDETETLLHTHFIKITEAYDKVRKHHKKVLKKFYTLEKTKAENHEEDNEDEEKETTRRVHSSPQPKTESQSTASLIDTPVKRLD